VQQTRARYTGGVNPVVPDPDRLPEQVDSGGVHAACGQGGAADGHVQGVAAAAPVGIRQRGFLQPARFLKTILAQVAVIACSRIVAVGRGSSPQLTLTRTCAAREREPVSLLILTPGFAVSGSIGDVSPRCRSVSITYCNPRVQTGAGSS
jgi:hypothetical protein